MWIFILVGFISHIESSVRDYESFKIHSRIYRYTIYPTDEMYDTHRRDEKARFIKKL